MRCWDCHYLAGSVHSSHVSRIEDSLVRCILKCSMPRCLARQSLPDLRFWYRPSVPCLHWYSWQALAVTVSCHLSINSLSLCLIYRLYPLLLRLLLCLVHTPSSQSSTQSSIQSSNQSSNQSYIPSSTHLPRPYSVFYFCFLLYLLLCLSSCLIGHGLTICAPSNLFVFKFIYCPKF